jgi:hypothetical protein
VRTSAEFALLKNHLSQKQPEAGQYFAQNLWIQCSTPENLLQVHQYLHHQPKGLIIDVAGLHGLLHGVDPDDPDLFSQYPLDVPLLMRLLNHVKEQSLETSTQLYLLLPHFHKDLIEYAVNLGMNGITVKPQDVTQAKRTISELEQKRFTI